MSWDFHVHLPGRVRARVILPTTENVVGSTFQSLRKTLAQHLNGFNNHLKLLTDSKEKLAQAAKRKSPTESGPIKQDMVKIDSEIQELLPDHRRLLQISQFLQPNLNNGASDSTLGRAINEARRLLAQYGEV
jgi:hypothetical protein